MNRVNVLKLTTTLLICFSVSSVYAQSSTSITPPDQITCTPSANNANGDYQDNCTGIDHAYFRENGVTGNASDAEETYTLSEVRTYKSSDQRVYFKYVSNKGNVADLTTTYSIRADLKNSNWQKVGFGDYEYVCKSGCALTNLPY